MSPEERKLKVLATVIEIYARDGDPVSSKNICDNIGISVSSATIRNDMAELTELGFLEQPHTSSGRIPTDSGYRLYVDKLMDKKTISKEERKKIFDSLLEFSDEPEHLLEKVPSLLASFTGFAAISTTPASSLSKVKSIQLVKTGAYSAMLVLITSAGLIKNKLFRCDFKLNSEVLSLFYNVLNEKFSDIPLSHITVPFVQRVAAMMGEVGMLMSSAFSALLSASNDAQRAYVTMEGQTNLLLVPEFETEEAKSIMEFLNRRDDILSLLMDNQSNSINILIGDENENPELKDSSVVVSRYNISDEAFGAIAIVGPTRMDYSKVIADLEFITDTVEDLLEQILE